MLSTSQPMGNMLAQVKIFANLIQYHWRWISHGWEKWSTSPMCPLFMKLKLTVLWLKHHALNRIQKLLLKVGFIFLYLIYLLYIKQIFDKKKFIENPSVDLWRYLIFQVEYLLHYSPTKPLNALLPMKVLVWIFFSNNYWALFLAETFGGKQQCC